LRDSHFRATSSADPKLSGVDVRWPERRPSSALRSCTAPSLRWEVQLVCSLTLVLRLHFSDPRCHSAAGELAADALARRLSPAESVAAESASPAKPRSIARSRRACALSASFSSHAPPASPCGSAPLWRDVCTRESRALSSVNGASPERLLGGGDSAGTSFGWAWAAWSLRLRRWQHQSSKTSRISQNTAIQSGTQKTRLASRFPPRTLV